MTWFRIVIALAALMIALSAAAYVADSVISSHKQPAADSAESQEAVPGDSWWQKDGGPTCPEWSGRGAF
jgi:hypothetical protein